MPRGKLIAWSPHRPSQFVIGANDLRLYKIGLDDDDEERRPRDRSSSTGSSSKLGSSRHNITLIGVNPEVQQIKCLEWSPDATDPTLVAAGLMAGKIVLTRFLESKNKLPKEFVPHHPRPCNALAWNPVFTNQLASGLDKMRSDFSTLIWDVNQTGSRASATPIRGPTTAGGTSTLFNASEMEAEIVTRPLAEVVMSETTSALSWVPGEPYTLAVGTGNKWLRVYDLRLPTELHAPRSVVAHSKAINGVTFDPSHSTNLATFSEAGIVKLWDIRNLHSPIFSLNTESKGLSQIEWCPTRSGVLATIAEGEDVIKLWDLKSVEPSATVADIKPSKVHQSLGPVSSFSWHPSNEHRILAISRTGLVEVVSLHESIPVSWSPKGGLAFASGRQVFDRDDAARLGDPEDICVVMKDRAESGYSMNPSINASVVSGTGGSLSTLWHWVSEGRRNLDDDLDSTPFMGVLAILNEMSTSESPSVPESLPSFPVYQGPERRRALHTCGWDFDSSEKPGYQEIYLERLKRAGQHTRATALYIFYNDLKGAISCLEEASASNPELSTTYKLVAMSLAGYDNKPGLWRETVQDLKEQFDDPYLRAAFAFLCTDISRDGASFAGVLNETGLILKDSLAFACRYLSDRGLKTFMRKRTEQLVLQGNIEGLLLTGLSHQGVTLLENYIDRTGDVQTACLVMCHVVPRVFTNDRVLRWIECYRGLLDSWQLWEERALFDVSRAPFVEPKPPPQVYARCNFCNQSLSLGMIVPGKMTRSTLGGGGWGGAKGGKPSGNRQKISSCPGCSKPLPSCSICLLSMGVSLPNFGHSAEKRAEGWSEGSSRFGEWFSWCQNCHHGGHVAHIYTWFLEHSTCPVSDCTCNCSAL